MKLETFFEKFDLFADAPDAVAKMRELVLNLAVQGKLASQDANDEDIEHLLARNDEARRAIAKNDRRADPEQQPLLSAEDRWEIPERWAWRALADLVLFVDYRGKTPSKLSNGIRLLTAKNVRKGHVNLSPEEFLSEEDYHEWMTRGFPKAGDVLFTTEAPMGNAAVVNLTDRFALAQRVICFQSYEAVDTSFLVLQILSTQFQFILDKNGTGVTAKGIKASKLKQLPIALPPLAEQKRIVANVDELMALCDRLAQQQEERETRHAALARASLARFADAPTPANLPLLFHGSFPIPPSDLRKSILTLAVQGKLVPQDPNDEPAEESVRFARAKAKLPKRAALPDDFDEKPFDLPESWTWVIVSDAAESRLGKMLDKEKNRGEAHPYLRNTNVHWFRFELDSIKTMLFDPSELSEYLVEPGDVLICEGGHGIARSAVWEGQIPGIMFQKALHRVRPLPCLIGNFLAFCLRVYEDAGILQRYYTGAGIPHFTGKALAKVTFPLPPLAEQRRIVAKVDELMSLVDALETQLATARTTATALLAAALAELTVQTGTRGLPAPSASPLHPPLVTSR